MQIFTITKTSFSSSNNFSNPEWLSTSAHRSFTKRSTARQDLVDLKEFWVDENNAEVSYSDVSKLWITTESGSRICYEIQEHDLEGSIDLDRI